MFIIKLKCFTWNADGHKSENKTCASVVKYVFLLCGVIFISFNTHSQGRNNMWLLGVQNILDPNTTSIRATVDFSSGSAVVSPSSRKMKFIETQANISDTNGNLLMSSNGVWIANATGDTMMNGNGLNPNGFTSTWGNSSLGSLPLVFGNVFLPMPGDSNLYILLHMTANSNIPSLGSSELYSTIIDISNDNGLGGVVSKNTIIFSDTLSWGISACKHANGRDWWVTALKDDSNYIITILLTPSGFGNPIYQSFTNKISELGTVAHPVFSPDGNKFACATGKPAGSGYDNNVNVFDFDRCTGLFSNHQRIHNPDSSFAIGCAFSPNSKYLYTCAVGHIYQTNLVSVLLSPQLVATYDGFISVQGTYFYTMFLAADNRIYVTSMTSVVHQHVINYPDSAGMACDVQQHSLQIPCLNSGSVPNHPNYFLGAASGTICDSLTTSIHESKFSLKKPLSISPNPATNFITVNAMNMNGSKATLNIYNSVGELIGSRNLNIYGGYATQDIYIETLPAGIYIVRLEGERDVFVGKFVKE